MAEGANRLPADGGRPPPDTIAPLSLQGSPIANPASHAPVRPAGASTAAAAASLGIPGGVRSSSQTGDRMLLRADAARHPSTVGQIIVDRDHAAAMADGSNETAAAESARARDLAAEAGRLRREAAGRRGDGAMASSPASSVEERRAQRARRREFEDAGRLLRTQEAVGVAHTAGNQGSEYRQALKAAAQASQQVYKNELDTRIAAAAAYVEAADATLARMPGDSPRERRRTERADARLVDEMRRSLSPEQFGEWKSKHAATGREETKHRDATRSARDAAEKYRKEAKRARGNPASNDARRRAEKAYDDWAAKAQRAQEAAQAVLVAAYEEALEASGNGTVPCTAEMATVCIENLAGPGCEGKCPESECTCSMFDAYGNEMDRETLDPIRIKAERGQFAKKQEEDAARQAQEAAAAWQAGFRIERPHSESVGELLLGVAQGALALGSALGKRLQDAERAPYSDPSSSKLPTLPRASQGQGARGAEPGTFSRIRRNPVTPLGTVAGPVVSSSCRDCAETLATIAGEGEATRTARLCSSRRVVEPPGSTTLFRSMPLTSPRGESQKPTYLTP